MKRPSILLLFREAGPIYRKNLNLFCQTAQTLNACLLVLLHKDAKAAQSIVSASRHQSLSCDLDDIQGLRHKVNTLHKRQPIDHIFAFVERDVYTASICRKDNQIDGLQPAQAIHFRDKNVMHARARELGFKVPKSCHPHTLKQIRTFAQQLDGPIIIKPYNGAGSANTWKVDGEQDLLRCWDKMQDQRHDYRVEEFIHGTQYFVDMLMSGHHSVFGSLGRYTYHVLNFRSEIPGGLLLRSPLTQTQTHILDSTERLLQGFGLERGITHTEWFLTTSGDLVLGETAARFGGGPITSMIKHGYKLNIVEEWLKAELSPEHEISCHQGPHIGAEYFSADQYGAFGEVTDIADNTSFHQLKEVLESEIWTSIGDTIDEPIRCSEVLGYYICKGDSEESVISNFEGIRRHFFVTTRPR